MFPTRARCAKKNLLLCFDAFGTLFKPNISVPEAYAQAALKHGVIKSDTKNPAVDVGIEFKRAYKVASTRSPNYGKARGLGAERWWSNVRCRPWDVHLNHQLTMYRSSTARFSVGWSLGRLCHKA